MADDKKDSSFIPDRRVSLAEVKRSIGKGPKGLFTMPPESPASAGETVKKPKPSKTKKSKEIPKLTEAQRRQLVSKFSMETVTVGEFISAALDAEPSKSQVEGIQSIQRRLPLLGIELSRPWAEVATTEVVQDLLNNPLSNSNTFINLGYVEGNAKIFYAENKRLNNRANPYPFTQPQGKEITGGEIRNKNPGIARSFGEADKNPKAYQKRGSDVFKGVPKAEISIPKLVEATKNIPDRSTRAAVAFNLFVPFRAGEVASLRIDEVNLETGYIPEYVRGNKTRSALYLPEVALEILRDEIEQAKKEGRETVFDTSTNGMTKALKAKGGLVDLFKEYKDVLGRDIKGASDIRKLIPSLLANELGTEAGLVSSIMGHTGSAAGLLGKLEKITTTYYVAPVDDAKRDTKKHALNVIQHMFGHNLDATTINEIPANLNVSAKNLTDDNALVLDVITPTDNPEKIVAVPEFREPTPEERKVIKARMDLSIAELETLKSQQILLKTQSEIARIEAERELFLKKSDPEYIREQAELNEQRRQARLAARGQTPEATQELLGAPEIPRESTEYDYSREIKAGLTTPEDVEIFRSKSETEQARIIADFQPQLREFKKSELLKKIAKGVKTVAPFLVSGAAGVIAKGAEAVEYAFDTKPAGVPEEDLEAEQLMESLETGIPAPRSTQRFVNRPATEEALTDKMQRELAGRQRDAMADSARDKSRQLFRPTREELLSRSKQTVAPFAQQRSETVQEAEDKFESESLTQRYRGYFANRPN
tara:strand:+ start:1521 stop:3821 length:2301 start_codon:yes stop_codon:yes gene_type:complete